MPTTPHSDELVPYTFARRNPCDKDVLIDILYCGICHSNLHYARNEWGRTTYRFVAGHEILGTWPESAAWSTAAAAARPAKEGLEQFCENGFTGIFGSPNFEFGDLAADSAHAAEDKIGGTPQKRWKVGPGQKVGVIGLGQMGVKFAHAVSK